MNKLFDFLSKQKKDMLQSKYNTIADRLIGKYATWIFAI